MLSLLLAFTAAVETPRVVTIPKRARPAVAVRKRSAKRTVVRRLPRSATLCLTGSCKPVVADSYRLSGVSVATTFSGKMDVVKPTGIPCGVQGAPVCPKDGRQLVRTSID